MAEIVDEIKDRAEGIAGSVDGSEMKEWVERMARFGYVAKGIVYLLLGVLAGQAIFSAGSPRGTEGALRSLLSEPFGKTMLLLIALGLVAYMLWRLVQALLDPEKIGDDTAGLAHRAGYLVSALAYGGLALAAFQMAMGSSSGGGSSQQAWVSRALGWPGGTWLVGLVGLGVIGYGLVQFWRAYKMDFRSEYKASQMSDEELTWATRLGRFGMAARGLVYGIVGILMLQAARQYDPSEAGGINQALDTLARQPFGPYLLGVVALGLVAYGLYALSRARYRRIDLA